MRRPPQPQKSRSPVLKAHWFLEKSLKRSDWDIPYLKAGEFGISELGTWREFQSPVGRIDLAAGQTLWVQRWAIARGRALEARPSLGGGPSERSSTKLVQLNS